MSAPPTQARNTPVFHGSSRGLSQGQLIRKRFFSHKLAVISMIILAAIVLLAFTSVGFAGIPGWWKWDWQTRDFGANPHPTLSLFPPSIGDHPFGTDNQGRDVFAMTMRGTQQSLIVMVIIGTVATCIGTCIGAIAGFYRGTIDNVLMRITEIFMVIPVMVSAAIVGTAAGNKFQGTLGVVFLGIFVGLVLWYSLARLVRGEFLSLREREFVAAARLAGASNMRIIFLQILPNATGVIIVNATLLMSTAILLETSLSYLGLGIKSPDVSLGSIISNNQEAFTTRPWIFWWPGAFIVLICLCINFIGDGLRDAFDPRQKRFNLKKANRKDAASKRQNSTSDLEDGDVEREETNHVTEVEEKQ